MDNEYDIIIIGGGATGSGIALDATLRGYKTLLIEKDDFSSKASSNSTKLVHGGVRYLEKAVLQCNFKQFSLVKEALKERHYFLCNCVNMSRKLPIYSVVSNIFEKVYLYIGLKLYDLLSFDKSLGKSQCYNHVKSKLFFPFIKEIDNGTIGFYDGIFNDMKVNIALLRSAQAQGCDIYNYHEMSSFLYEHNKIVGIEVINKITQEKSVIRSQVIINATGYYCDVIRKKDDKNCHNLITFSKGSHIVIDQRFSNQNAGIFFQKTSDGRVLFILPWQNHTLVGTTEVVTKLEEKPSISSEEIAYLLENINQHIKQKVTSKQVLSHFSSIRPLINDNSSKNSENMLREHMILKSPSNLVSITGGKWTTYRKMAQECLDFIVKEQLLPYKNPCTTKYFKLKGNERIRCIEDLSAFNLDNDIKEHLLYHYGTNALNLLNEYNEAAYYERLIPHQPFIKAELLYCMKYEYVQFPNDFLFRRIALGKMNLKQCQKVLSTVVDLMAQHLQWNQSTTLRIYEKSLRQINELLQAI